jgi:hypothetical protein
MDCRIGQWLMLEQIVSNAQSQAACQPTLPTLDVPSWSLPTVDLLTSVSTNLTLHVVVFS